MSSESLTHNAVQPEGDEKWQADLRGEEGGKLLDAIDRLRELAVDQEVPLPQIVVIGEQNAGKSSVLEAISGVPFPTTDGLCTRFATEVVLRRSAKLYTAARLVGDRDGVASADFEKDIGKLGPLTASSIPQVVGLAAEKLHVDENDKFSNVVLRIEVNGPDQDHLSLVDLPGFFSYTRDDDTSQAPEMVKALARRYTENPRSIILAVIHARTEYATQETLAILKAVDPMGGRTMGVITSIDHLEKGSKKEGDFLGLAQNDVHVLRLGWHILRNPSFSERKDPKFDRLQTEQQLFRTFPWNQIPQGNCGAPQLKTKLSRALMDHISGELDEIISAINTKISENEHQLQQLGSERGTPDQRRSYLSDIASKHERLVRSGLEGIYRDPFFDLPKQRIRANVRRRFEAFEHSVRTGGHKWDFWSETDPGSRNLAVLIGVDWITGKPFHGKSPIVVTREHYLREVQTVLKGHRGLELPGSFNPLLVGTLFRDQSCLWRKHADDLVSSTVTIVNSFLADSLCHVTDDRRAQLIYQLKLKPILDARESAMKEKVTELMRPFLHRTPATYNMAFLSDYETLSQTANEPAAFQSQDFDRPACEKLVAALEAYYAIARATFVDNIINLGTEHCLLDGLDEILCSAELNRMKDEEVELLASEFADDAHRRNTLTRNLDKLRAGLEVCREHDRSAFKPVSRPTPQNHVPAFNFNSSGPPSTPVRQNASLGRDRLGTPLSRTTPRSASSRRVSTASASTGATTPDNTFKTGVQESQDSPEHLATSPAPPFSGRLR